MAIKCIDVSDHQKKIDWKKVKKAGIDHVIIRAGYGKGNTDSQWDRNIKGAIAAGINNIGVYWFSYAYTLTMAVNEANYCHKLIKPYADKMNLGVYFDWEYDSMRYAKQQKAATNKEKITAMTKAFCERIKALGYIPGFYYNYDYKKNYYDLSALPYVNWYALDQSNGEYKSVAIQQYGTMTVPGIKGKVDANWIHKDISKLSEHSTSTLPDLPKRGYYKLGDKGDGVKWIQKKLNLKNKGNTVYGKLKVDGVFDKKTLAQVELFQDVTHLKVDGKVGVITLSKLEKRTTSAKRKAVNFAVAVARDGSFAYGVGQRAHKNGCYFCGTNITGAKKAKEGSKWEKTYCCNPFIHASYAHGAGDKKMLEACKKNSQAGLKVGSWTRFGFKKIGKCSQVKYSDLKVGDLLLREGHHVCMFTGSGWIVEASGEGWGADTIAHKKIAEVRYETYSKRPDTYVMRYSK